jgi:hypothetical protein
MFVTVELLYGTGKGGKGKEKNIKVHYICAGTGYNGMY